MTSVFQEAHSGSDKGECQAGQQTHEEIGIITQAGNDVDLKNPNCVGEEGRRWIKRYQRVTGILNIRLVVSVGSKENGGTQAVLRCSCGHWSPRESNGWHSLGGR